MSTTVIPAAATPDAGLAAFATAVAEGRVCTCYCAKDHRDVGFCHQFTATPGGVCAGCADPVDQLDAAAAKTDPVEDTRARPVVQGPHAGRVLATIAGILIAAAGLSYGAGAGDAAVATVGLGAGSAVGVVTAAMTRRPR